ncbi:3'-5' exonuclease [Kingella kingae]|uniref:3'-5' exonuclease n=1 Tax=Kingella kingae TaxID=504 RepID=UPI000409FD3B|nr:3'-5' exonuclease [Kingella kingae]MDK4576907.1 3'-5' exonuclease [Kingella kingae]MDK4582967.1 3'-5' exonuclease [Kingella kingae]MDK4593077.1 3'-5' exonuclease [Kingella kingae]MDK4595163.1 3'-5' exonuclease [Kingella kingae]MDK4644837.1 3'-5' exonuclease [Kingella kingae]
MTPILVFDIETIPDTRAIRALNQLPPSISDADVVEFAAQQRRAKNGSDFMPHHLHKIVAISCCLRWNDKIHIATLGSANSSEAEIIEKFFGLITKYTPQLVSWNGGGFDLPVLHYRALIHGVQAARYWDMGEGDFADSRDFKYNNYISRYHNRHCDLMDLLAMYTGRANAPLDEFAKLCGFPGKMGMDGSQVWQAYQNGEIEAIRDYCETDVANTYLVFQRFRLMNGALSQQEYAAELERLREYLYAQAEDKLHWEEFLEAWDE